MQEGVFHLKERERDGTGCLELNQPHNSPLGNWGKDKTWTFLTETTVQLSLVILLRNTIGQTFVSLKLLLKSIPVKPQLCIHFIYCSLFVVFFLIFVSESLTPFYP